MTDSSFSATDIATFLSQHPDFFDTHADVFAGMRVPNPHGANTISLAERQILSLRERIRDLEWRLSQLTQNATNNESIGQRLIAWNSRLLAEKHPQHVPGVISVGLADVFDVPDVALRVWRLPHALSTGFGAPVSDDAQTFADSLKTPYCGNDAGFEAAGWLKTPPASLAIIALRPEADAPSIGLLVLGSPKADRFTADMGTTFLQTIGTLASAALQRLAADQAPAALTDAGI